MAQINLHNHKAAYKIAVVIHLFYEGQWPEFENVLCNFDIEFSLFVTLPTKSKFRDQILKRFPNAVVILMPNIGRDIAPFLTLLPQLCKFDLVCKLHTKRSEGNGKKWRHSLLQGLLGGTDTISAYLKAFYCDEDLVLAGPREYYLNGPIHEMGCAKALLLQHGLLKGQYGFFAGTMFWCRPSIFLDLVEMYPQNCFVAHEDNHGQPEHVVERAFGYITSKAEKKVMLWNGSTEIAKANEHWGNTNFGSLGLKPAEKTDYDDKSTFKQDINSENLPRPASLPTTYANLREEWAKLRTSMIEKKYALVKKLSNGPKLSVIVPVYNTDPILLKEMISSVTGQSYTNWELCIADDASTNLNVKTILNKSAKSDSRIRVVLREKNGHISHASNSAIEIAQGQFLVFLDHDDILDRDALLYVAECIFQNPAVKIIYTDEDKISMDGTHYDPHFKPDWNRELLYCINYVSHLGVYSAEIIRNIGGFRAGYEGAQDYDVLLRCLKYVNDSQIHHIPKVLYSWRASPGSTATSPEFKSYTSKAGLSALSEALSDQFDQPVEVSPGPIPNTYLPHWPMQKEPSVTIIMPTRDHLDITRIAVNSILEKTLYVNFEIVIVDNGSVEAETVEWLKEIALSSHVRVIRDDRKFNFSALNNNAVKQSKSNIIALVNNDIEIISGEWLKEMVSLAIRADVGCVGAKLYYSDNTIQHAGVIIGIGGVAGHAFKHLPRENTGYFGRTMLRQEYTVVTGACLVVKRTVYEQVGGLNEENLSVAFNDVDFCLKVKAAGYRNLWTPLAEMYHHESTSRKADDTPVKRARFEGESDYIKDKWQTEAMEDPSYNHNLTRDFDDFRFGPAVWVDIAD